MSSPQMMRMFGFFAWLPLPFDFFACVAPLPFEPEPLPFPASPSTCLHRGFHAGASRDVVRPTTLPTNASVTFGSAPRLTRGAHHCRRQGVRRSASDPDRTPGRARRGARFSSGTRSKCAACAADAAHCDGTPATTAPTMMSTATTSARISASRNADGAAEMMRHVERGDCGLRQRRRLRHRLRAYLAFRIRTYGTLATLVTISAMNTAGTASFSVAKFAWISMIAMNG